MRVRAVRAGPAAGIPALGKHGEPGAVVVMHHPDLAGDRAVRAQGKPIRLRGGLLRGQHTGGGPGRLQGGRALRGRAQRGRADGRQAVQQPPWRLPRITIPVRLRRDAFSRRPRPLLGPPAEPQSCPHLAHGAVNLGACQLRGALFQFPRARCSHDRLAVLQDCRDRRIEPRWALPRAEKLIRQRRQGRGVPVHRCRRGPLPGFLGLLLLLLLRPRDTGDMPSSVPVRSSP